jgi:hypothetical protein
LHPRAHHWVEVVEIDEQELLIIRKRVAPALAYLFVIRSIIGARIKELNRLSRKTVAAFAV